MTVQMGPYLVRPAGRWHTRALALLPLVDEWTLAPPSPPISARSLSPSVSAHVTRGTLVLTGLPERALPHLSTTSSTLSARLSRPGRPDQTVAVTIPAGSALPHRGAPIHVTSATIAVTGRVTAAAFPHGPIAGAELAFSGTLVAVSTPIAADHAAGVTVRARTLTPGATTTLTVAASAGQTILQPASSAGMAAGAVLQLTTGEYCVVAGLPAPSVVELHHPLRTSPAAGSTVTLVALGGTGAATALSRAALPGDGVLPLAGPLAAATVEIVDGNATEYRATGLVTDADGRWRLSGVRGITELRLTTSAAGFQTDGPRTFPLAPIDPYVITTALGV